MRIVNFTDKERKAYLGSMSDYAINKYLSKYPLFGGVYANDYFKVNGTKPAKNKAYVFNLDNSDGPGTHWVALLPGGLYIDPFAGPPSRLIAPFVKKWNKNTYQSIHMEYCGYFCIYVIENYMNGIDPLRSLIPGKLAYNQNVLKNYFI